MHKIFIDGRTKYIFKNETVQAELIFTTPLLLDRLDILFLSKECHTNGCIGTLDVTYPSIPFCSCSTEGNSDFGEAHNCNLSLKAILGIASYGKLFDAPSYLEVAKEYAAKWQREAANEEATRLVFDIEDANSCI